MSRPRFDPGRPSTRYKEETLLFDRLKYRKHELNRFALICFFFVVKTEPNYVILLCANFQQHRFLMAQLLALEWSNITSE